MKETVSRTIPRTAGWRLQTGKECVCGDHIHLHACASVMIQEGGQRLSRREGQEGLFRLNGTGKEGLEHGDHFGVCELMTWRGLKW